MGDGRIQMGVIGRPHGVRGLLHVHSYAEDPASLAAFSPLFDAAGRRFGLRWVAAGVAEVSELVDGQAVAVRDRAVAERLVNTPLFVERARLPAPEEEEFYLADLVGLQAVGPDGAALGTVSMVHDYGAGASLEIGSVIVPFTRACVPRVDLAAGVVEVVLPVELGQ